MDPDDDPNIDPGTPGSNPAANEEHATCLRRVTLRQLLRGVDGAAFEGTPHVHTHFVILAAMTGCSANSLVTTIRLTDSSHNGKDVLCRFSNESLPSSFDPSYRGYIRLVASDVAATNALEQVNAASLHVTGLSWSPVTLPSHLTYHKLAAMLEYRQLHPVTSTGTSSGTSSSSSSGTSTGPNTFNPGNVPWQGIDLETVDAASEAQLATARVLVPVST
jgi:hypothetical protein